MTRDVDYEHEPDDTGSARTVGNPEEYPVAARLQQDIEVHGESHANFKDVEGEVEVRIRTATFNYEAGLIEIWDGDVEIPFSMDKLVNWEQPMDVYH